MDTIHKKNGRLHIYVRQDKYKGELKSHNWVGRTYIDGKQKIFSSSTTDLEKANDLLQQEIMHNFINSQTELKLSYAKLQNIFELIHTDNNNWQFSLSKKWSIFRSLNNLELHLNSES